MKFEFYYSDKDDSKFLNQRTLNEKITNPNRVLQTRECNALTIRLLFTDSAFKHLKRELDKINDKAREFKGNSLHFEFPLQPITSREKYLPISAGSAAICTEIGLNIPPGLSGPDIVSSTYKVEDNFITHFDNSLIFPNILAHMDLYNYFTNFCSVLDRFSQEVNILLDLNISKMDWNKLLPNNTNHRVNTIISNARIKHPQLFNDIDNFHLSIADKHIIYRNRLIHDGLVRFKTRVVNDNLVIFLQNNPDDSTDPFSIDAIDLFEIGFEKLLLFLDSSYQIFLQYIDSNGQPPWI